MTTAIPYGLRDIKITPYTDAAGTVLGSPIDLPYARTLSFTDTEDFEELRGDDRVVATHGNGASVEWEMESGGFPFEAFQAMAGGTLTTTGAGPTTKQVFSKKIIDARPYFKIEGQVISDSGGDVHCVIYKAKCTGELSGEFSDGEFFLTSASGIGIAPESGADQDKLYDFVYNATVTSIVNIAATGAIAGVPGAWVPAGATPPANLAAMTGKTASPNTDWVAGQYMVLGDGSYANWNGTAWVAGIHA